MRFSLEQDRNFSLPHWSRFVNVIQMIISLMVAFLWAARKLLHYSPAPLRIALEWHLEWPRRHRFASFPFRVEFKWIPPARLTQSRAAQRSGGRVSLLARSYRPSLLIIMKDPFSGEQERRGARAARASKENRSATNWRHALNSSSPAAKVHCFPTSFREE